MTNGDVELKQLSLENAQPLFDLMDKNRFHLQQWLPWVDGTKHIEDTENFIQSALANKNAFHCGIWYQGSLVGIIGYHYIDNTNHKASIGYWLDANAQGKGIMTTAVQLILTYGFDKFNLNRIEISCAVGNEKSCAIPKSLGFTDEGTLRDSEWLYDHYVDHKIYALLKKDWK